MFGRSLDLGNPVSNHPINRGLVGWWLALPHLSGGSRIHDITFRRNHGTLTNGTTWVGGRNGFGALSFDGVDDEVTFAAVPGGERFPPGGAGTHRCAVAFWWTPFAWPPATSGVSGSPIHLNGGISNSHYPFTDGVTYLALLRDDLVNNITSLYPSTDRRRVFVHHNPGGNSWRMYENGRLAHSTTSKGYVDLGTVFRFGYSGSTSFRAKGQLGDVAVWINTSPAADAMALADYQQALTGYPDLLNWQRRRAWSFGADAGGGVGNRRRRVITGASA